MQTPVRWNCHLHRQKFCHSKLLTMELQPSSFRFFYHSYLCQLLLTDTGGGTGFPPWSLFIVGAAGIPLGVAVHCEQPGWPRNSSFCQQIRWFRVWRIGRWAGLHTGCSTLLWSWQHWSGIWSMWNGEIQYSCFLFFFLLQLHCFQFFKFVWVHMIWKKGHTDFSEVWAERECLCNYLHKAKQKSKLLHRKKQQYII